MNVPPSVTANSASAAAAATIAGPAREKIELLPSS